MIKHRKYDDEKISEILCKYGLKLLEFNTVKNIVCIDDEGYKYRVQLSNLLEGKKPSKTMLNPFAFENFKLYLLIHYPHYILLDDAYCGCKGKMRFLCTKHIDKGVQINYPSNIMNNHHACKYCSYEKMREERILPKEIIIQMCEKKNVVYKGQYTKDHETYVQYVCEHHIDSGVQEMSLTHFKESKLPCHFCGITSGEQKIKDFLDRYDIFYVKEKMFDDCVYKSKLRFDYYIPSKNMIIEYDGQQHYMPVRFNGNHDDDKQFELTVLRDKIKNKYCFEHGIKLLRIPYYEFDNIDSILQKSVLE